MEKVRNLEAFRPERLDELVKLREGVISSKSIVNTVDCHMMVFAVSKGESISSEVYSGDMLYYVLSGEMSVSVAEEIIRVKAGECLRIPAGTAHDLFAEADFKLLQILTDK